AHGPSPSNQARMSRPRPDTSRNETDGGMETPAFPTVAGSFIGWLVSPATERAVPNETALPPVVITRSTANRSLDLVFMRLYPPATTGGTDRTPLLSTCAFGDAACKCKAPSLLHR